MKVQEDQNHPVRDQSCARPRSRPRLGSKRRSFSIKSLKEIFPNQSLLGRDPSGGANLEIDAWIAKLPRAGRQNAILDKARAARRCNRNNQATPAA